GVQGVAGVTGVRVVSAQHPEHGPVSPGPEAPAWTAYVFGVVRHLRAGGYRVPPAVDIAVDSSVPEGAGLSSSAALECAVALALAELGGADTSSDTVREDLVRLTRAAEHDAV